MSNKSLIFNDEILKAIQGNKAIIDNQTQNKIELQALFIEKINYRSKESYHQAVQDIIKNPNLNGTAELFLSFLQFFYSKYENPEYAREYMALRQFEDFYKEKLFEIIKGSTVHFIINDNLN